MTECKQDYWWAKLSTGHVIPVDVVSNGNPYLDDVYIFGSDEPMRFFGYGPCPSWYRGAYVVEYLIKIEAGSVNFE